MLVELHGGQFANKGAQKMLLTTIKELRRRLPKIQFVADGCVGTAAQRRGAGIQTLLVERKWMGGKLFSQRLAAQIALGRMAMAAPFLAFGRTPLQQVDALVDLAGFAYSDQWGAKPTRDFSSLAQFYHRNRKPVVLLPQAFGPFQKDDISESFHRIGKVASVIYARDRQSLELSRQAASPDAEIRLCPDITFAEGAVFQDAAPESPIYLVPNMRIVDRSDLDEATYLSAFQKTIDLAAGRNPVRLLIHDDTGQDLEIARKLNARLPNPIEVISESDPWALKKMISEASLIVGSRYHALVAALSCGVPCVAVGWSHKYGELLADFGCSDHLFNLVDDFDAFAPKLDGLMNVATNQSQRTDLRLVAENMCRQVEVMWDDVAELLARGTS